MSAELVVRDRRHSAELRDPKGATLRSYYQSPTLPQVYEWDATQAFRLGYCANVIAYRCVQLRASAVASIPLVAGRRQGDYKTLNEKSPILELLGPPPGGPAPKLSATKLLRWTMAQEIVTGRRAWEIETANGKPDGRPVRFWPLCSANLRAKPTDGGMEWFKVFETGTHHDPVKLQPDEVFFGWDPAGLDFRQAESPLQACRYDLSLVTMCDRYGIGFLKNNAVPATIVTTTKFPDEESRRRFLQNWSADFQGPDNAGRMALNEVSDDGDGGVSDSIDVKVLGLSAKDSRLVESRKEAMLEIAIALGTPWSKLDASGRTYDNAEAEDRTWYENTILDDLTDLQDDINMQLAPRFGDDVVWFDLRKVRALRPKQRFMMLDPIAAAKLGLIVPNEIREDNGLDPMEGGDEPLDVTPVVAPTPLAPPPPVELPPAPDDDNEVERLAPAAETREVDPEAVELRKVKIWRASDASVRALEQRWERAWRRMFARQLEATLSRLTGKRGRQALARTEQRAEADPAPEIDPALIFDEAFWRTESAQLTADLFEDVTTSGLVRLAAQFGIDFDLAAPWVSDFVESRVQDLAGQVTQTTYDAIRSELQQGVGAGESIDKLADRIRAVFTQASDNRATTIARTEVISAYNGAATLGANQLPRDVVAAQEWIATRDGRTRESHAAVDGQVVAIGEPFSVGGFSGAYPGDPGLPADETINCRCAVAFLTPDEFEELQGRSAKRVEVRTATALLRLVTKETDLLAWRRALEEVAA